MGDFLSKGFALMIGNAIKTRLLAAQFHGGMGGAVDFVKDEKNTRIQILYEGGEDLVIKSLSQERRLKINTNIKEKDLEDAISELMISR